MFLLICTNNPHGDHLGSASWITDYNGEPIQYIHYMPYGELWVNQRNSTYDERYKFTGKERDAETGYDYFGARNYSSAITTWLSVDPLAEKYYYISPYAWCGNNPILNIDKNGQYYYDFWTGAYHSSYGNHDEVDWAIIQANNYVEPAPTKELTPLHAVAEFIAGSAPTERSFTEGDKYTQQFIKDNPRLQTLLDNIAQEIFVSNIKEGEENYDLAEKEDIERFGIQVHDLITAIGTLLGDRIGCSIGNVAASTIGSFDLHWELEQYDNNGDAVVRIKMTNPMSAGSFFYSFMIGYSDFWRNHKISSQISEFFNSNANKSGMLHTVNMTMTWTTTIKNPNR